MPRTLRRFPHFLIICTPLMYIIHYTLQSHILEGHYIKAIKRTSCTLHDKKSRFYFIYFSRETTVFVTTFWTSAYKTYPAYKAHAPCYIAECGLTGCTYFSTMSHKRHYFWKKVTEHKMCGLSYSTNFVWNISNLKKNSWRYYHKRTEVFM